MGERMMEMGNEFRQEFLKFIGESIFPKLPSVEEREKIFSFVERMSIDLSGSKEDEIIGMMCLKLTELTQYDSKYLDALMEHKKREQLLQLCDVVAQEYQCMVELITLLKSYFHQEYSN